MENTRYPTMDQLNLTLDPTLSFQFPQSTSGLTPLPQTMSNSNESYPTDIFSQSYVLQNLPTFNVDDNLLDGMPKSSHDDLNQFFNDAGYDGANFGGYSPGVATPGVLRQQELDGSWLRKVQYVQQSAISCEAALAVDTSGENVNVEQRETLVMNGQVTPGNSPSSPQSSKSLQPTRKLGRLRRATTKAVDGGAVSVPSASASASADDVQPLVPTKRARKPRKNARKPRTAEQEAAKRETFLKRNREAAYKCRIKKKTQTEMIVERAKQLDQDNAMKGLEIENLRREVESMRAMLLPHWRTCSDEKVNGYVDGLVKEGWGLGKMLMGAVMPRAEFDAGEEPREDDGCNGEEVNESPTESVKSDRIHPLPGDDNGNEEEPAHKRRCSEAVFEMSMDEFTNSIASMDTNRHRRESFFGNSLGPEEVLKDALCGVGGGALAGDSFGSSGSATPTARLGGMDMLNEEFLVGDTPPPLDLSAPDERYD